MYLRRPTVIPNWWAFTRRYPFGTWNTHHYFCASTETIKDTANNNMHKIGKARVHPLEILAEAPPGDCDKLREEREASANKYWNNIPAQAQKAALMHVEVYLDNLIGVVQGGPTERRHTTRYFPQSIEELFHPTNPLDVARE